jgi:hypothetical protein
VERNEDIAKGVRWLLAALALSTLIALLFFVFHDGVAYVVYSGFPVLVCLGCAIMYFRRAWRRK